MTFELTSDLVAHQVRAREAAMKAVAPAAEHIDRHGALPDAVQSALDALQLRDAEPLALVVALEEVAAVSAAAAARVSLEPGRAGDLAGLTGVPMQERAGDRQYLAMAAVFLGIGRAAVAAALDAARGRGDRPAGEPSDAPHWVLADAATEMDGARLLVHSAAAGAGVTAPAAFVHAGGAASRAVDAALRIVGPEGYRRGSILERATRDVRSAWLVLGSEDQARRVAADALLA